MSLLDDNLSNSRAALFVWLKLTWELVAVLNREAFIQTGLQSLPHEICASTHPSNSFIQALNPLNPSIDSINSLYSFVTRSIEAV